MAKDEKDRAPDVLEEGDIFFLYRPTVEEHEPEGLDDVERFYMVLRPRGGKHSRLMVIGRKTLPDVDAHERNWGFVDMVSDDSAAIEKELREDRYETKTRGMRTRPAARPAGEGAYMLIQPGRDMHFVYSLELPDKPGKVQRALGIEPEAAFVVSIKNPEKGSPKAAGLSEERKADYPKSLQQEFEGRRFAPTDPHLLDFEGAEFILVGARDDPEERYGIDIPAEDEEGGKADIFTKLRMARSRHPAEPLFEGKWA